MNRRVHLVDDFHYDIEVFIDGFIFAVEKFQQNKKEEMKNRIFRLDFLFFTEYMFCSLDIQTQITQISITFFFGRSRRTNRNLISKK